MSAHTSLLDLTQKLLGDDGARADFAQDPDGFLDRHGLTDLSPDDVTDGLGYVADTLPPALAVQLPNGWADDHVDAPPTTEAVVDQLRTITEIDPDLTLDDLTTTLDHDPGEGFDDDPHGSFDEVPQGAAEDSDPTGDPTGDQAGDPAGADDQSTDEVADDGGFGTGGTAADTLSTPAQDDAPTGDAGEPVDDSASGFEMGTEPSFDFGAEDSFVTPPVPDELGDADELDTDNGDWDGSWESLQGHHLF